MDFEDIDFEFDNLDFEIRFNNHQGLDPEKLFKIILESLIWTLKTNNFEFENLDFGMEYIFLNNPNWLTGCQAVLEHLLNLKRRTQIA